MIEMDGHSKAVDVSHRAAESPRHSHAKRRLLRAANRGRWCCGLRRFCVMTLIVFAFQLACLYYYQNIVSSIPFLSMVGAPPLPLAVTEAPPPPQPLRSLAKLSAVAGRGRPAADGGAPAAVAGDATPLAGIGAPEVEAVGGVTVGIGAPRVEAVGVMAGAAPRLVGDPAAGDPRPARGTFVPPLLHRSWPDDFARETSPRHERQAILEVNPDMTAVEWTDASTRALVRDRYAWFLPAHDASAEVRAELSRFFIAHARGGVYAARDTACVAPFGPTVGSSRLVLAPLDPNDPRGGIASAPLASERGHPFWDVVFEILRERAALFEAGTWGADDAEEASDDATTTSDDDADDDDDGGDLDGEATSPPRRPAPPLGSEVLQTALDRIRERGQLDALGITVLEPHVWSPFRPLMQAMLVRLHDSAVKALVARAAPPRHATNGCRHAARRSRRRRASRCRRPHGGARRQRRRRTVGRRATSASTCGPTA